jgi:hypothetical protein
VRECDSCRCVTKSDRLPAQRDVARNYLHDQGFLEPWSRCGQPSRPDLGEFEPGGCGRREGGSSGAATRVLKPRHVKSDSTEIG